MEAGLFWLDAEQKIKLQQTLTKHSLDYIGMIFTDVSFKPLKTVKEHVAEFERQLAETMPLKPILVNVHGGRDSWPQAEALSYFDAVLSIAEKYNVNIVHETHRSRILFNPWATLDYVKRIPNLQLCADLSHFVCVAERLTWDDDDYHILDQIAPRVRHIHARVGQEQAPQVSDPRAPEWLNHVHTHESWWQQIWSAQAAQGASFITMTPEYGPTPYLPALPYSGTPVTNLNEIIDWQAQRLVSHFTTKPSSV